MTTSRTTTDYAVFVLPDPVGEFARVRLWQEVRVPGDRLDLTWADGFWTLTLPRPAVDRMEYLFVVDGEHRLDPGNPDRVGGAFGDHSVLEFPGYRSPPWLGHHAGGTTRDLVAGDSPRITAHLWTPDGLADDEPAPLVACHDGPEYDRLGRLTDFLDNLGVPVRAALLEPGDRNDWYAANGTYGAALTGTLLPLLRDTVAVSSTVGVGASLGALEMLIAHRDAPDAFDALFLQSGSYFTAASDAQERDFPGFGRIARAVGGVLGAAGTRRPVPVVMTCGRIEENLTNNRTMARALHAQGYPVALHEVNDVHNYTAWRDAFEPHLRDLLRGNIVGAGTVRP